MALDDTAYTDVPAVPESGVVMPGNVAPDMTTDAQQAATEPQLTAAVGQLNAGQPVTALPHQTWSLQQAQAWNAKLGDYDRRANAARIASEQAARDAALLDQMSRVAKSTKDIEVAMQQNDVQQFVRWVGSGGNPVVGLTHFPRAATSPLVAAVRAANPGQATWVPADASGAPGHFQLPGGGVNVPPATKVAKDFQPQEASLSDGTKLVYNPNTGAFKLVPVKGEEKPMTSSQLVAIANALPSKDPNAKTIFSFLSSKATNQLAGASAAKPALPAATLPPVAHVRRKSDGKLLNYRGNPADIPRDQYDVLP